MKQIIKSPLFWLGILIKLGFLFVGGSENFHKLFIPFLDNAVQHLGENPWSFFPSNYFPYGSLQFVLFAVPKAILYFIFGEMALGNQWLSYFSIKIVLFIFDILLLFQLSKLVTPNQKKLLIYFWLNPVLFYISYIHGQLDVVPMFFSILSLLYLVRKKTAEFSILAAAAALCKFHTVAIVPFAMAYLWNTNFRREGIQKIASCLVILMVLLVVGFWPQIIAGKISQVSLGSPEALSIFGVQLPVDAERYLFLGFLGIVGVISRLCVSTRITPEGLIYGTGVIYGSLLLGAAPGAGWYYWFLPFVALFYSTRAFKFQIVFLGFNVLYLAHFVLRDFLPEWNSHLVTSISFSLLQFSVLALMISIWVTVIKVEAPLLRRVHPLMVGLAGNSGSGKNTVTEVIQDLLGARDAAIVEGDDYHKWERGHLRWQDYTHLHPKANFLDSIAAHTRALRTGKLVTHPHYDHNTGKFTEARVLETSKSLIVQGLHTFYSGSLRQLFDIKIFMAPDENLRTAWKVRRDVQERGHSIEKVLSSIQSRKEDSDLHINPQKKWADWIVESKMKNALSVESGRFEDIPEFYVRHILWNDTPLDHLVENIEKTAKVRVGIEVYTENIDKVVVTFAGDLTKEQVQEVAETTFPYLRHLVRSYQNPIWRANSDGFFQLILLALIERQNFMKADI
jgi:uridine kinase